MRTLEIAAGTTMLIGSPAKPMPRQLSEALAELVASIDGVIEAHLPQCFAVGDMETSAQILVVCLLPATQKETVLESIDEGLPQIIPSGEHLDVWLIEPDNSMIKTIRSTGCQIYRAGQRHQWWKFW